MFDVMGKLVVIERELKRGGTFKVADLILDGDAGKFSVNHPTIDQYATGSYEGKYTVRSFKPHSYSTKNGHLIVDIRAELDWDQVKILVESSIVDEDDSSVVSAAAVEAEIIQETERNALPPEPDQNSIDHEEGIHLNEMSNIDQKPRLWEQNNIISLQL